MTKYIRIVLVSSLALIVLTDSDRRINDWCCGYDCSATVAWLCTTRVRRQNWRESRAAVDSQLCRNGS